MPKMLSDKKGRDAIPDDEKKQKEKAGGYFQKKVEERVQPVVAALDRFRPALEENTREIRELTKALRERR